MPGHAAPPFTMHPSTDSAINLDISPDGAVHLSIPLAAADPARLVQIITALQASRRPSASRPHVKRDAVAVAAAAGGAATNAAADTPALSSVRRDDAIRQQAPGSDIGGDVDEHGKHHDHDHQHQRTLNAQYTTTVAAAAAAAVAAGTQHHHHGGQLHKHQSRHVEPQDKHKNQNVQPGFIFPDTNTHESVPETAPPPILSVGELARRIHDQAREDFVDPLRVPPPPPPPPPLLPSPSDTAPDAANAAYVVPDDERASSSSASPSLNATPHKWETVRKHSLIAVPAFGYQVDLNGRAGLMPPLSKSQTVDNSTASAQNTSSPLRSSSRAGPPLAPSYPPSTVTRKPALRRQLSTPDTGALPRPYYLHHHHHQHHHQHATAREPAQGNDAPPSPRGTGQVPATPASEESVTEAAGSGETRTAHTASAWVLDDDEQSAAAFDPSHLPYPRRRFGEAAAVDHPTQQADTGCDDAMSEEAELLASKRSISSPEFFTRSKAANASSLGYYYDIRGGNANVGAGGTPAGDVDDDDEMFNAQATTRVLSALNIPKASTGALLNTHFSRHRNENDELESAWRDVEYVMQEPYASTRPYPQQRRHHHRRLFRDHGVIPHHHLHHNSNHNEARSPTRNAAYTTSNHNNTASGHTHGLSPTRRLIMTLGSAFGLRKAAGPIQPSQQGRPVISERKDPGSENAVVAAPDTAAGDPLAHEAGAHIAPTNGATAAPSVVRSGTSTGVIPDQTLARGERQVPNRHAPTNRKASLLESMLLGKARAEQNRHPFQYPHGNSVHSPSNNSAAETHERGVSDLQQPEVAGRTQQTLIATEQDRDQAERRKERDADSTTIAQARTKSAPVVCAVGPVSATSRVNGAWLEFIVQFPVEATISEFAQYSRKAGFEVWRRPGENKLRCSIRPEAAGPMMHVSVMFSNTGDRKGSRVRLRRSRADLYLTDWWRYVHLQRDLMMHFDQIFTQAQA